MTWAKLLASNNVTRQPATKKELDNLRSIVSRSLKDVTAPGLSADARFIMAYDAARTLSLMIVRASGYRPKAAGGRYNTFLALETTDAQFAKLSAGMAGTMTVELYRGIARSGIRHVQCRNEQGASLMADGYARATGKPGVCTIIAGPGVTNAATGIAQAYCDSQPLLVLSGGCVTRTQGKGWGAIHELNDQAAVTADSPHSARWFDIRKSCRN
jgi:hypothetical protein